MKKWTSVLALAVGGALIATMAFAQAGGGNTTAPSAKQPDASAPSASPATGGDKAAPSASPSTADDASKATPGGMKSDTGKSDTMKSDGMKSDMSKGRGMRS